MRHLASGAFLAAAFVAVGCAISGGGARKEEVTSPAWLSDIPQSKGWLFAIGEAGPYFFEQKGWETAEKNGRENLALAIQARVESEYVSVEGIPESQGRVRASQEVLDIGLYGAQVLERYEDPITRHYYVLVGITASIAAENIIKAGQNALKEKMDQENVESMRQKKEELMKKLEE